MVNSEAHGSAFARSNGLEKLGILNSLQCSKEAAAAKEEYPHFSFGSERKKRVVGKAPVSLSRRRAALGKLKKLDVPSGQDPNSSKPGSESLPSHRPLPVHEHPEYLLDAISNPKNRVIIISPWITRAVVNRSFLEKIERALRDEVEVLIGYGIGGEPNKDASVEEELTELSGKYENFTFKYFGDTHAKILMKDTEYYIISSFNWLSFRGDPTDV